MTPERQAEIYQIRQRLMALHNHPHTDTCALCREEIELTSRVVTMIREERGVIATNVEAKHAAKAAKPAKKAIDADALLNDFIGKAKE